MSKDNLPTSAEVAQEQSELAPAPEMAKQNITAQNVADYLAEHPDFFTDYPDLVAELALPHQQKGTVSLVEMQTEQLRTQLHQQRQELASLMRNADNNEQLFQVYAQLLQSLYNCTTLESVEDALRQCFKGELALANVTVDLFVKSPDFANFQHHQLIDKRFKNSDFFFGRLGQAETKQIFNDASVSSCALMLLGEEKKLGILAVGSDSPTHFHPDMDTLFLLQLKRLLEQVLGRILEQ
jgi:uncharacterized protein YigA (DUF484 family)